MFQVLFWEVSTHLYTPSNQRDACKVGMRGVAVIPIPRWGNQGQSSEVNNEPVNNAPTQPDFRVCVLNLCSTASPRQRGITNRNIQPIQNNQQKGKCKAVTQVLTRHSIIIIWTFLNNLESHQNPTESAFPFHSTSKLPMSLNSIPWINLTEPGRILLLPLITSECTVFKCQR